MDQEPETPKKPYIPPPNLAPPPPPPPSPLEGVVPAREPVSSSLPPAASVPPAMAGGPPVKVQIRDSASADDAPAGVVPINSRLIAALIDFMVSISIFLTLVFILPGFLSKVAWLAGVAYLVVRDSLPFLGGQSVGKKAMKLKAVTLDDQSLVGNWEKAIIRNITLIIGPLALVELVVLLTREDKPERGRRLGDEWAKTKVIVVIEPPAEQESI